MFLEQHEEVYVQTNFVILIRSNGKRVVRDLPVTLKPGEQLVIAHDVGRVQAPKDGKWTVHGYQVSGNTCRWDINKGD